VLWHPISPFAISDGSVGRHSNEWALVFRLGCGRTVLAERLLDVRRAMCSPDAEVVVSTVVFSTKPQYTRALAGVSFFTDL
jgi:hypothetical protein